MDQERYARIHAVLNEAILLPGREREAFLARTCDGDDSLRAEVEALIALESENDALSETAIEASRRAVDELMAAAAAPPHDVEILLDGSPRRIGPYHVLRRVGAGGMGIVFEAQQDAPRRRVALKVLHSPSATDETRRRFRLEAELLGRLQHPNIAQIFESGSYDLGRGPQPFFALEFVTGVDLRTHVARERLDSRAVLRLLAIICGAVHHAHERGIIHRDLKPENILVDAHGIPKILDFGVARATERSTILSTLVTAKGEILGTLGYMAPEQLSGDPDRITPATDVYALGVMAFELLCGRLPHRLSGLPLSMAIQVISDEEAPRLGEIEPSHRGDVEEIVGKALEKDPSRRYPSAAALAADIGRHLEHLPITARPPSRIYRMRKYVARKKAVVLGVSGTILTLLIGLVVSLFLLAGTQQARDAIRRSLYASEMRQAGGAVEDFGGVGTLRSLLAHWIPDRDSSDLRGWEWFLLRSMAFPEETVISVGDSPICLSWLANGSRIAAGASGDLLVWNVSEPAKPSLRIDHGAYRVRPVLEMPGSGRILTGATAFNEHDPPRIQEWDPITGARLSTFGPTERSEPGRTGIGIGALSPDGGLFEFFDYAGCIRIWDTRTKTLVTTLPNVEGQPEAFDPTGRWLATGGPSGASVQIWDVKSWQRVGTLPHKDFVQWVSWSRDGLRLATASARLVTVWDVAAERVVLRLEGHRQIVRVVEYSPDGTRIASSSQDRTVRLWDSESGECVRSLRGHEANVTNLAWHPDSRHLATSSDGDCTIRIWDTSTNAAERSWSTGKTTLDQDFAIQSSVEWSADGKTIRTYFDGTTRLWAADTGKPLGSEHAFQALSPQGDLVASGSEKGVVIERSGGEIVQSLEGGKRECWFHVWAPSGDRLIVALNQGYVNALAIWDPSDSAGPRIFAEDQIGTLRAAWHPSGERFAYAKDHTRLTILDARSLVPLRERAFSRAVLDLAYSHDGNWLATAHRESNVPIRLLSAEDLIERRVLIGHTFDVNCLAWSPDDRRLASGSGDGTIKIWDPETGNAVLSLRHDPGVVEVAWSPDGKSLASLNANLELSIWDASRGYAMTEADE